MRTSAWCLLLVLLSLPRTGWAQKLQLTPAVRAAVAERQGLRLKWRQALVRAAKDRLGDSPVLFHQIRVPEHRAAWKARLAKSSGRPALKDLRSWLGAGSYPGLWTIEGESAGWYGSGGAGKPVQIALRPGLVLFDEDIPEHRRVYEDWLSNERKLRGANPPNVFDSIKDSHGVPLSRSAGIIHAPTHERFYRELGVAGIAYHDYSTGRKCVILLNPSAIRKVTFPD